MRWGLLGLLGCPRTVPPPAPPAPQVEAQDPVPSRTPVPAGASWSEPGGLCLEVPATWSGSSGPPPHLLALSHEGSGVRLDLFAWSTSEPAPDEPSEWELVFFDDGGYRTVPLLSPSSTSTWATGEPQGPTRQSWSGQLGERTVRVEATYPFDWAVAGRDLVEPLLEALCSTAPEPQTPEPRALEPAPQALEPGPSRAPEATAPEPGGSGAAQITPTGSAPAPEPGDQQGEEQQRQP